MSKCLTAIVLLDSSVEAAVNVFLRARNQVSAFQITPAFVRNGMCFCLSVIIQVLL